MPVTIEAPDGYGSLALAFGAAIDQASRGKGKERHAEDGEPFGRQIICEVARRVGLGYPLGQAVKKIYESQRLGGEKGVAELLGAINYIAAAVIVEKEELEAEREEDKRDHEFLNSVFAPYTEKPKAEGCEKQNFKPGDKVQARDIGTGEWMDAVCLHPIDGGFADEFGKTSSAPVSAPEPAKVPENVCLGFAERVVSLMKEAGVREVSFAGPGARICADGTVTGLHFMTESVSAPEDFQFDEARMRESMPGIVPQEDREPPLFLEGTPVEFLPEERCVWEPAMYRGMDSDGRHLVAARGGVLACVPADRIRKPENADPPRFQNGELVEYRLPDGTWKPAHFACMDGGYAVLVSGGEKFEVLAFDVRPAEKA